MLTMEVMVVVGTEEQEEEEEKENIPTYFTLTKAFPLELIATSCIRPLISRHYLFHQFVTHERAYLSCLALGACLASASRRFVHV